MKIFDSFEIIPCKQFISFSDDEFRENILPTEKKYLCDIIQLSFT